jgi:hypothetical protein
MQLLEKVMILLLLISSNEKRFGGDGGPAFAQAEVRIFRLTNAV